MQKQAVTVHMILVLEKRLPMKNLRFHRWIKDQVQLNKHFNLVLSIFISFLQTQVAINLYVVVLCSFLLICWLCSSLLTCWLSESEQGSKFANQAQCRASLVFQLAIVPPSAHVHAWVVQVNGPLAVPHGQPLQCVSSPGEWPLTVPHGQPLQRVSSPGEWPFDCATWTTPPVYE